MIRNINLPRPPADLLGIGLSSLCALHCALGLAASLALSATSLSESHHSLHMLVLGLAAGLSFVAFMPRKGQTPSRWLALLALAGCSLLLGAVFVGHADRSEMLLSILGSLILCCAHILNLRRARLNLATSVVFARHPAHSAQMAQTDTAELNAAQRQALNNAGEQWTPLREQVFLALAAQSKPTSAYDIADSVSQALGRRIAPNTVYRMLDLFVQANLATRIESRNAYLASAHPQHRHDCIFLVCEQCGETRHLDDDTLTEVLRTRAAAQGYTALKPVLEVKGLCAACSAP